MLADWNPLYYGGAVALGLIGFSVSIGLKWLFAEAANSLRDDRRSVHPSNPPSTTTETK